MWQEVGKHFPLQVMRSAFSQIHQDRDNRPLNQCQSVNHCEHQYNCDCGYCSRKLCCSCQKQCQSFLTALYVRREQTQAVQMLQHSSHGQAFPVAPDGQFPFRKPQSAVPWHHRSCCPLRKADRCRFAWSQESGAILKKWTAKSERWYNNKKRRETHGKH